MAKEPVGHCKYHDTDMTCKQMKLKECLNKKNIGNVCPHFERNENHVWWENRERMRNKRKIR